MGDAPRHYIEPSLQRFCVEPANVDASAAAILELAGAYERWRDERASVVATLRGSGGGYSLLFNSHMDTSTAADDVLTLRDR